MRKMPKLFVAILAAAIISLATAVAVYTANNRWESGEISGQAAFPSLGDRANDVTTIEIAKGGKMLKLVRDNGHWEAKGDYEYPVKFDRVRSVIIKLSQAELIEPKTRLPEKYELLGLNEPGKDSEARRLRLLDADGKTIVEAILGKKRWGAFGSGKSGTYVRKPDNPRTWLASLDATATPDIKDWAEKEFFKVDLKDIRSLTLEHAGEEPLAIHRKPGDEAAFELSLPSEESKIKKDGPSPKSVAEVFKSIELEDLRKRESPLPQEGTSLVRLETKDGLNVTFRHRKVGGDNWISVSAKGTGEAAGKAEDLNARTGKWEFKIPGWKADKLFRHRSDFLETS
jgi:hypothetical protein